MEYADFKSTISSSQAFASNYNAPSSSSPSSSGCSSPPSNSCLPPPAAAAAAAVLSPCAACKILRRRCSPDKCVLAPYFPPTDPLKFTTAHRIFGASNINKLLQELPESQRADAVSSMVYEANARIRDPVYGCAGAICQLQKQVSELQGQLARAQADLLNMQCQQAHLLTLLCVDMTEEGHQQTPIALPMQPQPCENWSFFSDDATLGGAAANWEPLWA